VWVACCVTTPAAYVSVRSERPGITGPWGRRRRGTCGPARLRERPWGRRSVHRLAKMASRRSSGAFVYTVASRGSRERTVGTQECTQIGENGLSTPFWGICVHCCAAGSHERTVGTQQCTQIGENGLSTPFRDICVHCCDTRLRRVARTAPSRGRRLHRGVNPHKPR